jgi:conjugative relaxase-like TrwC/TraI family protein
MLSVAKLGVGQEQYYLDSVASGVEDYYLGAGEEPGQWAGHASGLLGLAGGVHVEQLGHVLAGRDPTSGTRLTQDRPNRVPGFDLTFSAPKSVSVLFGIADIETAAVVRAAHDAAVEATLGWLERQACRTRAGADGVIRLDGEGFVAAKFVHRTSRAGDPQLHTHVLVANMTRSADGKWRALDGKALLLQAQTAGYLYKAQLRHELVARLGVEWGPIHRGASEIVGIPAGLLRLFATRRREIEAELAARGLHTAKAARIAALETRPAKIASADLPSLRERWQTEATAAGHDLTTLADVGGRAGPTIIDRTLADAGSEILVGPAGLTRDSTVFDGRALRRGWCEQLPQGAPINAIERLALTTLTNSSIVKLGGPTRFGAYTTAELMALERRLVNLARLARPEHDGGVDPTALRGALDARPSLSAEQVAAVAQLTTSPNAIHVFIAAAGTGKTFCLDTAADAWQRAGYRVIGAALAATAAAQLQTQTGIPSDTIALRTIQINEQTLLLDPHTVLVIDEAAMAGTRNLAPLLEAAANAGAKVVLVGDPKQLDAIQAGGLLAGLARRILPVTLVENRRQTEPWERDALKALRAGNAQTAFAAYESHGRVVTGPTAIDIRDRMTADWYAATVGGETAIMIAERNSDIDDLNLRARQHLTANKQLTGPALVIDGRDYQQGERVLCVRNDRKLGVRNGTVATITNIDHQQRAVTIRTDRGFAHALPARYLDAGHLRYGYAFTIHKSQGATVDTCLLLGSDTLDQNRGYTALSRGRTNNRIYLVETHQPDPELHHHKTRPERDPRTTLVEALGIDHADRLAIDQPPLPDRRPTLERVRNDTRQAYLQIPPLRALRDAVPPSHTHEINALQPKHDLLSDARHTAAVALEQLRSEQPAIFRRKEHAVKLLAAERRYDNADATYTTCDDALQHAVAAQATRDRYLEQHRPELDKLERLDHIIDVRLGDIVAIITQNPPSYLHELGTPPSDSRALQQWQQAARVVEDHRIRHAVTDPSDPFGPPATEPRWITDYNNTRQRYNNHQHQIAEPTQTIEPPTQSIPDFDLGL